MPKITGFSFTSELITQCDQRGEFFELLDSKFSYKSNPNIIVNFWAILNNTTFMIWLHFGKYCEKLGNLLFHNLATLL